MGAAVRFGATEAGIRANVLALHPISRLGRAEDIARAILHLASDDSSFFTGAELVVDGSLTAQEHVPHLDLPQHIDGRLLAVIRVGEPARRRNC